MKLVVFLRRRIFSKRYFHCFILCAAIVAIIRYATLRDDCAEEPVDIAPASIQTDSDSNRRIHLGAIACGDRAENALVMVKSALMFGTAPLHLHLFPERHLCGQLKTVLDDWRTLVTWRKFTYTIHSFHVPEQWKVVGPACAVIKLFIADWITTVDAMLVMDTDIVFLRPIDDLWSQYSKFNQSHMIGMADAGFDWYKRSARYPTYKHRGSNFGIALMNLTRMREFGWSTYTQKVLNKYQKDLAPWFADQDVVNILLSYFPEKLYIFGCEWNYQPTHCVHISTCEKAESDGASVLHAAGGHLRGNDDNAFKVAYEVFKQYKLGTNMKLNLYDELHLAMGRTLASACRYRFNVFLKALHEYFDISEPTRMPYL